MFQESTASCNLNPPIRGSAIEQNHHQEPNLPNLMAKPVNKVRQIRYNLYGILIYLTYLIIPWIADSSEYVCFLGVQKMERCSIGDYSPILQRSLLFFAFYKNARTTSPIYNTAITPHIT